MGLGGKYSTHIHAACGVEEPSFSCLPGKPEMGLCRAVLQMATSVSIIPVGSESVGKRFSVNFFKVQLNTKI